MRRYSALFTVFLIFTALTATAAGMPDTAFTALYQRYLKYYSAPNAEKQFFKASEEMQKYYKKNKYNDAYYKIKLNEVLYSVDHNKPYIALEKAHDMLKEMKTKKDEHYNYIYSALGIIYESRGNYRIAEHYYMEALKNTLPKDSSSLVSIYARLAYLNITRNPEASWIWNEKTAELCNNCIPAYTQQYLVLKAAISFYMDSYERFEKAYNEYWKFKAKHPETDEYGQGMLNIIKLVMDKEYDKALSLIGGNTMDFAEMDKFDMRIKIYNLMGNQKLMLEEVGKKTDYADSLNSDMIFNNINEVNAKMGIFKMEEKSIRDREQSLYIIITLLTVFVLFLLFWIITRLRAKKELVKKNNELMIALERAEESDLMKTAFIKHVSHEMRTPLNVITGFAQIISNPEYELNSKERNEMLNAIGKNTNEITNIINELLEMAQEESKGRYPKSDEINCNEFCSRMLSTYEKKINKGRLSLTYTTDVPDTFVFKSNEEGIKKIIGHLLKNALKFTEQGSVSMHADFDKEHKLLTISVTDTGIGIAEENRSHIFESFYKVDAFKQGMGLGLTMCKKISHLLDGDILLDNNYHNGCRFIFELRIGQ
jgi:signal transduction histidine kinase